MKYFVLGAIASGTLLYGMSPALRAVRHARTRRPRTGARASVARPCLGLVFVVVAVAFKFGAVPFHMWVPDVYQGAPASVTLLVATAPKLASFALAFRLLSEGLAGASDTWTQMLGAVAVLSMVVGNVIAIAQTNLRGCSRIPPSRNVGFILLGFVSGTPHGYRAALYYTLTYVLMVLGRFGVLLLSSRERLRGRRTRSLQGPARP
jgi:NADH-quinone oxidoreductase subunit N